MKAFFANINVAFNIFKVPPLTPGTNMKMDAILKNYFEGNLSWESYAKEHKVPENPKNWSENDVKLWFKWTMVEFNFGGFTYEELISEFKVVCDILSS